ncbi:MAG: sigma-54 dependent transcriptional regulator [Desulfobacterales bacterium]|nr:sigma-54 dependent transcriptional regulator [Desulfobacterales bacterium]
MESMVQEVTNRFFRSLQIEESLFEVFCYLESYFPMTNVHLAVFNTQKKYIHYLASATKNGGRLIDREISLSPQAYEEGLKFTPGTVKIAFKATTSSLIHESIINSDADYIPSVFKNNRNFSLMVMTMDLGDPLIGFCNMSTPGLDMYSPELKKKFFSLYRPVNSALLNLLQHMAVKKQNSILMNEKKHLLHQIGRPSYMELIGTEGGLANVMKKINQVARIHTPVLLTGETGTGKEVFANAIHQISPFNDGPMISINCGAIPPALIESELFGYEKGAFTGAGDRKAGYFEQAGNGTLFLDEIGELPLASQVKFLRVLQEKVFFRVGGQEYVPMNARIVAATHNNLEAMVKERLFREDLWFRLNVFPIHLPPLRDRKEDIPELVTYFLSKKRVDMHLTFTPRVEPGAMERLLSHHWPGNIRELENCVERNLITCEGKPLTFQDLMPSKPAAPIETAPDKRMPPLDDVIVAHIQAALSRSNGRVGGGNGAAQMLGLNKSTLWGKIRKYGIDVHHR